MAAKKPDMRCLELQGQSFRYVSKKNGVRIHRKLDTLDIGTARRMRDHFERTGRWDSDDAIVAEALKTRTQPQVDPFHISDRTRELIDSHSFEAGYLYNDVVHGKTPLDIALKAWHGKRKGVALKDRTKADHKTAVDRLGKWLKDQGQPVYIETMTSNLAERYADHLDATGVHPRTANKHLNSLRSLWTQSKVHPNPWSGVSLDESTVQAERERPFSDDEVAALLTGGADDDMLLVLKVGLVTGARLEEIFKLRACDVKDGVAALQNSKRKGAITRRPVPLHASVKPTLEAMAARLTKAGKPDSYLFEGKDSGWDGARSMAFSKRFRTYREACGVDAKQEGQRRSSVNFHSCRRWFVTKLEKADTEWTIVQRLIGHKIGNLAGDVYSGGGDLKALRAAVNSVKLPI